jgi:nucleoside-specific outer membrane channel protein Tsx
MRGLLTDRGDIMTLKHIKKGLGLAALALGLNVGGAAHAGFSTTEVQLHYGGGYKFGSNATFGSGFAETTNRATVTLEHFSTNDIGDLFFFVDFFQDNNDLATPGRTESDQYGEIYYTLHGKQFGLDMGDGFIKALDLQAGLNKGTDFSVALFGPRVSFNVPGFQVLSLALTSYTNFDDPFDRNLDTTYQATVVWKAPFQIGNQKFLTQGFVDFIGDQGSGVDNQIVFSPQIRWDLGHALGKAPGKIHLGVEYTHFNNKFGATGVDENSASIFLGFRF